MKLIWNGHSCFTLETAQGSVVFDPYADGSVPGYPPLALTADAVLCSHGHRDHGAREKVTLTGRAPAFLTETLPTFHDPERGALRGENTIHIVCAEGLRVAHLGDLGCDLTAGEKDRLRGVDALLLPVGGYYTIDAAQAAALAQELLPRVTVPMHYRGDGLGYDVLGPVEDFLRLRGDVRRYGGNALELTADTPRQTAVLTFCPMG